MNDSAESVLLQEGSVTVTSTRFVVGSAMYPIRGITRVDTTEREHPAQRGWFILLAIVSLFFVPWLVVQITGPGTGGVIGLVLGAVACVTWIVAGRRLRKPRTERIVSIWTAGTNTQALRSFDGGHIGRVVEALHRAVAQQR